MDDHAKMIGIIHYFLIGRGRTTTETDESIDKGAL